METAEISAGCADYSVQIVLFWVSRPAVLLTTCGVGRTDMLRARRGGCWTALDGAGCRELGLPGGAYMADLLA
jgi:hypothetical protein